MQIFAVVVALATYAGACDSTAESTSPLTSEVSTPVVLRPVTAGVDENLRIPIESTQSTIDKTADLYGAYFVNASNGWVFSQRSLFGTSDSAKSWKRLPLELPANSRISSIFFIDENRGWLARNTRLTVEPYGPGNSAAILVTVNGGASWIEQANFPEGVQIKRLKFFDANLGLAVGARIKNHKPPYEEFFLAKTVDGGTTWTDISFKAKPALDNGAGLIPGNGCDLHWLSPSKILLLISDGRLIVTSDGGENWKAVASFEDERPNNTISSVSYYKLLLDPKQRIRIIAGAMGDEGYWGDLVVNSDQNNWASYELPGMPILDAIHLSENEILACGTEFRRVGDNKPLSRVGVVIYSSDAGRNWTPLYRSHAREAFIDLVEVGSNQFYAVSDGGTLLQFSLKNGAVKR